MMRALICRALAGVINGTPGTVVATGDGRLTPQDAATQRTSLGLGNAATRNVGTATGTVAAGDDARFSGIGGGVPAGVIVMWHGLLANIPAGWLLCDGTNGTPDMRDRFVKGAPAGIDPGGTGGAATHQHTYTQVPNHFHNCVVNDPGHAHVEQNNNATTGGLAGWAARDTSTSGPVATGYSTQSAQTGITVMTLNPDGGVATGTTAAASSEPPHLYLAFIMKL